ncbi:T/G mismatch-specific endonuclease [Sediminibacterium ginsengisoli]|uniref:Very short patch repair endonuclease n=2 Tax=Sediminibacterium ginsengisoli TaxID=413434 RepID=A0A1T4RY17_9BACT|nr:T/G mismatch-specific endonuclease [Sediminibacterium ginsengisoli]
MSRIKGKNTKPEMLVRKFLFSHGLRYKLHDKKLHGKPDLVLPKYRTIIFINGCFWHGHDQCRYFVVPKTKTDWWLAKINANKANDAENIARLLHEKWKIIVIWECDLKADKRAETLQNLLKGITNRNEF